MLRLLGPCVTDRLQSEDSLVATSHAEACVKIDIDCGLGRSGVNDDRGAWRGGGVIHAKVCKEC